MSKDTAAPKPPGPWENRWHEPSLDELLAPVEDQRCKVVRGLIENFDSFEGITHRIDWHGTAWKWTIHFTLTTAAATPGEAQQDIAFIVPAPNEPIVCVPLDKPTLEKLPMRRLNRFIRDGIKLAKCAVQQHWAMWTPSAQTEVEYLTDLVKRIHKMRTAEAQNQG